MVAALQPLLFSLACSVRKGFKEIKFLSSQILKLNGKGWLTSSNEDQPKG